MRTDRRRSQIVQETRLYSLICLEISQTHDLPGHGIQPLCHHSNSMLAGSNPQSPLTICVRYIIDAAPHFSTSHRYPRYLAIQTEDAWRSGSACDSSNRDIHKVIRSNRVAFISPTRHGSLFFCSLQTFAWSGWTGKAVEER